MDELILTLAKELGRSETHVENVVNLIDEGATIPFIARYRKELHGSMDDQLLRTLADRLQYLRNLAQRKQEVLGSIEGQGKLTEALSAAIDSAATLAEVEDLYRPYKQKRRTRATVAKEKGLEPLALMILQPGNRALEAIVKLIHTLLLCILCLDSHHSLALHFQTQCLADVSIIRDQFRNNIRCARECIINAKHFLFRINIVLSKHIGIVTILSKNRHSQRF